MTRSTATGPGFSVYEKNYMLQFLTGALHPDIVSLCRIVFYSCRAYVRNPEGASVRMPADGGLTNLKKRQ